MKLKKGDVYSDNLSIYKNCYFNKNGNERLPKEVVETWEPVYQTDEKTVKIFSSNNGSEISITFFKTSNYIEVDGHFVLISDISKLLYPNINKIMTSGFMPIPNENLTNSFHVELLKAKYKIGCSIFTLTDIRTVIFAYDEFKKS